MNKKINKMIELISKHDKIALFHHIQIDGDSLSSSYGLMQMLKLKFPKKTIKWVAEKEYIKKRFSYLKINFDDVVSKIDDSFLAIIGDTSVLQRVYNHEQFTKAKTKICFDHHTNEIDFDAEVFWHEPDWIASSMQAYQMAKSLDVPFDENKALMILFGIITDSGRFSYSEAEPLPLQIAAELMQYISNETMNNLYQNMSKKTLKSLKFQSWVFNKLKIEDHVGYVKINHKDQQQLKMDPDSVTRVNLIANIEDEKIWIFFVEYPDFIRVEFRSNGIPVNEIAKQFNGGGHIKASGCHIKSWDIADKILEVAKLKTK